MFGLGMPELIVIMLVFLILFGARRLPEIGSGIGETIRNFRKAAREIHGEIEAPGSGKERG
jgi:sec-independent protein translocase protein TatA